MVVRDHVEIDEHEMHRAHFIDYSPIHGSGLFSLRNFVLSAVVSLLKNRLHFDEHLKLTKMQTQKNDNESQQASERASEQRWFE